MTKWQRYEQEKAKIAEKVYQKYWSVGSIKHREEIEKAHNKEYEKRIRELARRLGV